MIAKSSTAKKPTSIKSITVKGLFGYLNYTLPEKKTKIERTKLFILYGDNGTGKTTILRLTYSLLSYAQRQGDKTFLSETPFKTLTIDFDNGLKVSAKKKTHKSFDYKISITHKKNNLEEIFTFKYSERKDQEQLKLDKILNLLASFGITYYFLSDRRDLKTTLPNTRDITTRDSVIRKNWEALEREKHYSPNEIEYEDNFPSLDRNEKFLNTELYSSIQRVEERFRQQALTGSSEGHESANSIYMSLIKRLGTKQKVAIKEETLKIVTEKLKTLSERAQQFNEFAVDEICMYRWPLS